MSSVDGGGGSGGAGAGDGDGVGGGGGDHCPQGGESVEEMKQRSGVSILISKKEELKVGGGHHGGGGGESSLVTVAQLYIEPAPLRKWRMVNLRKLKKVGVVTILKKSNLLNSVFGSCLG